MREQPQQQPPPVQRLRVQYAKRGRLRFTSHRDFSRAFERAVVRARIPMAYSSGFNPHARISYAGAAPTGSASEAEYLELALSQVVEAADVQHALSEALPEGLDIVAVIEAPPGALADRLQASRWLVELEGELAVVREPVARFLAHDEVIVERMTKRGLRSFDCRGAVVSLTVEPGPRGVVLDVVLRHETPAVRPDDVLSGLVAQGGLAYAGAPLMTRLAQGPLDDATHAIGDPLRP